MTVLRMPKGKSPSGYRMLLRNAAAAEIYLYGPIGQNMWGDGISAKQFADDLKALGNVKTIDMRVNSEGGDVFAGKAMYTLLNDHKANITCYVDGLAASAASFVCMAADDIAISEGAFVMVHNAWTFAMGSAPDLRKTADLLDSVDGTIRDVYASRTGASPKQVKDWMDAETWFNGQEAVDAGFADRAVENMKVAASVSDPNKFRNLPASLRPNNVKAAGVLARMASRLTAR